MKDTTKQRIDEVRFLHLVESASMSAKRAYFNIILPFLRERQIRFDDECDPCRLRIAVGDDDLRIYETCQVLRIFAEGEQVIIARNGPPVHRTLPLGDHRTRTAFLNIQPL